VGMHASRKSSTMACRMPYNHFLLCGVTKMTENEKVLYQMGMIDINGRLTELGIKTAITILVGKAMIQLENLKKELGPGEPKK